MEIFSNKVCNFELSWIYSELLFHLPSKLTFSSLFYSLIGIVLLICRFLSFAMAILWPWSIVHVQLARESSFDCASKSHSGHNSATACEDHRLWYIDTLALEDTFNLLTTSHSAFFVEQSRCGNVNSAWNRSLETWSVFYDLHRAIRCYLIHTLIAQ